jgi:hypothetical protein
MMIQNKTQTTQKAAMLNAEDTLLFLSEMDKLCNKMEFNTITNFILKTNFKTFEQEDINDFIDRAKEEHKLWYENPLDVKVTSIAPFNSKCIACSFGKTVKAYQVTYNKMNDKILPGQFIYSRGFAIKFEIINGELNDFAWCNLFLNKNESDELSKK